MREVIKWSQWPLESLGEVIITGFCFHRSWFLLKPWVYCIILFLLIINSDVPMTHLCKMGDNIFKYDYYIIYLIHFSSEAF